jgi:hypothetical protein
VIILGRDEPSVRGAEQCAMAIWYDTKEPIERISHSGPHLNYPQVHRAYITRDNSDRTVEVSVHPDPRVQAVVEQAREAEMLQAIDRLRLIHADRRKTVYILCKIPLDMPVDWLVTWKQLIADNRLGKAVVKCEERGWDAPPLAPKELTRLFPELWKSEPAARRWADKKPLERSEDIIRDWGAFEYRPGRPEALVKGSDPPQCRRRGRGARQGAGDFTGTLACSRRYGRGRAVMPRQRPRSPMI